MNSLYEELKKMSSASIEQLLQSDALESIYSPEEIQILQEELAARSGDVNAIERIKQKRYQEQIEEVRRLSELPKTAKTIRAQQQLDALKANGYTEYFEYKILSFLDYGTGEVALNKISEELNEMGRNGWRLKSTFTNEIGKTSESTRLGAVSSGTNATIEQTVFIFERKVPIVE